MRSPSTGSKLLMVVSAMLPLAGCKDGAFNWSFLFPEKPEPAQGTAYANPLDNSAAYRDTVAELAYFDGLRRLRVRGFGIVVGLGRNGSARCPTSIRGQLIQEMYKTRKFAERRGGETTPESLIDDMGTAVVAVEGEIPSAAAAGSRFDLVVRAVPGTDTTSLEGGWLLPCNLTIYRTTGGAGWIPGRQVATGSGPVFLNPFGRTGDAPTQANLREGAVIGGGQTEEDRRIRLLLTVPSYQRAVAIAQRINERFGDSTDRIADAVSPAEVRVRLPANYRHEPRHFLALVQHLYLPATRPGFLSEKRRELVREFVGPDAPHVEIALAWEAIGRNALPDVQEFYNHAVGACSFHAAVAGLRLGDDVAVDVVDRHLKDVDGPFRMAAIQVCGAARHSLRAARPLRQALADTDPRVRIAAYEALLERDDPTIGMTPVGDGAFVLDRLNTPGDNLIYAKRSGDRRIAIFGDGVRLQPPVFMNLPDDSLMIDAGDGDRKVVLVRTSPVHGTPSPPVFADLAVSQLIALMGGDPPQDREEPVRGLGVDYSSIVLVLSELCRSGSINADFVLESPALALVPRMKSAGRPESELGPADPASP